MSPDTPPTIHAIALDAIDPAALARDRTGLDPQPFEELRCSILGHGLRTPVEVFARSPAPEGAPPYALISGYRRLMAVRTLNEDGHKGFETIPALIRDVTGSAEAYRMMVEENAVRAGVSPWEAGRVVAIAARSGIAPSIEAAVDLLHPSADRRKRDRIRAVARLAEEFDGLLLAPERLSQDQLLRLADACRGGFAEAIVLALEAAAKAGPERQWAALAPLLAEHAAEALAPPRPRRPGRPRRAIRLRHTLAVRRERGPDGYVLRFSGPEATSPLLDEVLDRIEQIYTPG